MEFSIVKDGIVLKRIVSERNFAEARALELDAVVTTNPYSSVGYGEVNGKFIDMHFEEGSEHSVADFINLFTAEERKAIRRAARLDEDVEDWLEQTKLLTSVNTKDSELNSGMQLLVNKGIIEQSRLVEIMGS